MANTNRPFWKISEANAEIARLDKELAAVTAERDAAKAAIESNGTETASAIAAAQEELTKANAKVGELTDQISAKDAELATVKAELEKAKTEAGKVDVKIQQEASAKAQQIVAQTGVTTPIAATPAKDAKPLTWTEKAQAAIAAKAGLQ